MQRLALALVLVTVSSAAMPSGLVNCQLALDDDSGSSSVVAMSASERQAFASLREYARSESGGNRETYLRIMGDTLHVMGEAPIPKLGERGPAPKASVGGDRSANDIVALVKRRQATAEPALRGHRITSEGPAALPVQIGGGTPDDRWSIARLDAELMIDLAGEGLRPKSVIGQPVRGLVFRSSVAIVDPASYDDKEKRRTLGPRAICSGTRIGHTTILTAAHCVCDLALHTTTRRVRIGPGANTNSYVSAPRTVPERTVCYPGTGGSEDCVSSFCAPYWASNRTISPSFFGRDLAIIAIDGGDADHIPEPWRELSAIASPTWYQRKERHFILGFGFNPKVAKDAGLGTKRCGQMVAGPDCGKSKDLSCGFGQEITLVGDVNKLTDACPGDSGGGAFLMERVGDSRKFHLAGVVSRGPSYDGPIWEQCGDKGSIYSFASNPDVVEWIRGVLRKNGELLQVRE